jgi:predicted dehydrogenase
MYRFALIGCGRIAPRHAENINRIGKLVAVCDIIKDRADKIAKENNATSYTSFDDLLLNEKDIDVISICTPNGFHAEHSIKSLQAGKHVLCEKPLCITSAAAWQMMETEKFSRKKLFVVKSTRYNPLLQELKKWLDADKLGKIYSFTLNCFWNRPAAYYTEWRGKSFPDGGTLYTQFSHYIDAMIWLFGDIKTAKGFSTNLGHKEIIEFEDTGVASLLMESGIIGNLHWSVNSYERNCEIGLSIIAEKGTIIFGGEYLNEIRYQKFYTTFEITQDVQKPNNYGFYNGSMSNHKEVYDNLIKALEDKDHPFTNAFDGLKTVEAIEKIYKAVNDTSSL